MRSGWKIVSINGAFEKFRYSGFRTGNFFGCLAVSDRRAKPVQRSCKLSHRRRPGHYCIPDFGVEFGPLTGTRKIPKSVAQKSMGFILSNPQFVMMYLSRYTVSERTNLRLPHRNARTHLQAIQDRHAVGLCQYKVLGARF